jgi:uncharacterized protein
MAKFFHYTLRTNDVAAARAFYAAVLGTADADIVQLHERALARGARPHWLGHLDVGDVDAAAAAFSARGAEALGPKWVNPQGLAAAVVRDPGGAIVSLANPGREAAEVGVPPRDVAWHSLHTTDVERAKVNYGQLFGWEFKAPLDLGALGVLHPFAYQPDGEAVGDLSDIAQRSGVHPHWLFHFRVAELESALAAVRREGGSILGPFELADGRRIAACDDPQGAAFALMSPL